MTEQQLGWTLIGVAVLMLSVCFFVMFSDGKEEKGNKK